MMAVSLSEAESPPGTQVQVNDKRSKEILGFLYNGFQYS